MGTERVALRFRVLGPLEVCRADEPLALGGERQRALLALLLIHANELLSTDRLVDELMGSRPHQDGVNTVRVMIARLRRALGEETPVHTRSGGYVLEIAPEQLDAAVFDQRLARARQLLADGDPRAAHRCAADALDLWRGEPFADLQGYEFLQPEIRRLVDLRLLAVTERIEAELAGGAGSALVPELKRLVDANPLEERLQRQLMTALYRAGRQSEALEVYGQASALLRDELGLAPSPELQELQRAVLNHDPALNPRPDSHASRVHLPRPATPFLGREPELEELRAIMASTDTRLVTLTGAGGTGKTRLALRAAEDSAHGYEDGVWFVGFADVTDPQLIAATICTALGLTDQALAPLARLHEWCRDRHVLFLLDNLEQLAEGSAVLAELLAQGPRLKLLVTSREPLHLAGEHQYEVPVLREDEAIELFTRQACAVTALPNVNLEVVPDICRRLDHLPLAIELAAARQKLLSTEEILDRLTHGLPMLARGPRDAPRRQQTLRATIDWSYELLDPEAQRLFACLGVFAGGCTFEAAEKVCGATLDGLQALVDRGLLRSDHGRVWMLQTLREYALERLAQDGHKPAVQAAHAAYMLSVLRDLDLDAHTPAGPAVIERLIQERENFYAALAWAHASGDAQSLARITWTLTYFWWIPQGQLDVAETWVTAAMEHRSQYPPAIAGEVLVAARVLALKRGENERAAALADDVLEIWRALDDRERMGEAMMFRDIAARNRGDRAGVQAALDEAIAFARENGLKILPNTLINASDFAIEEGRLREGRALNEEALECSAGPESFAGTIALINLAHVANVEGRFEDGLACARRAASGALERGDRVTGAWAAVEAAWSLAESSEPTAAARLLGAAVEFLERAGIARNWMDVMCEERAQAALRTGFGDDAVTKMVRWGRAVDLERALAETLRSPTRDGGSVLALPLAGSPETHRS